MVGRRGGRQVALVRLRGSKLCGGRRVGELAERSARQICIEAGGVVLEESFPASLGVDLRCELIVLAQLRVWIERRDRGGDRRRCWRGARNQHNVVAAERAIGERLLLVAG